MGNTYTVNFLTWLYFINSSHYISVRVCFSLLVFFSCCFLFCVKNNRQKNRYFVFFYFCCWCCFFLFIEKQSPPPAMISLWVFVFTTIENTLFCLHQGRRMKFGFFIWNLIGCFWRENRGLRSVALGWYLICRNSIERVLWH